MNQSLTRLTVELGWTKPKLDQTSQHLETQTQALPQLLIMSQQRFVIVGGGIAGLMIARMIRAHRDRDAEIVIVERESHFGGQYSCVDYGTDGGCFDHGMHVYYDTSIPEVDILFTSIWPDAEWNIYEQNCKDLAGIYVNGRLQTLTPWVDLRLWPEEKLRGALADIMLSVRDQQRSPASPDDAYSWLMRHYGRTLTDDVYVPILQKLYYHHASELSSQVIKISALNRVVLFDAPVMLDLMKAEGLRARLGYPDQYTLPPYRSNNQRAVYPKQFGFYRAMDRLREVVEKEGSRLLPSTTVDAVTRDREQIRSVRVRSKSGETTEIENVTELYWTSGLPPLAKTLGIDFTDLQIDSRPPGWYVHFLLDQPPAMDRLYYFYGFEPGTRTFRVTNYSAYCPGAATERGYPICVELWADPGDSSHAADAIERATHELMQFGVINGRTCIRYCNAERVGAGGGVPLPTLRNARALAALRSRIRALGLTNLRPAGVMAEPDVFFVPEVLTDAWHKVVGPEGRPLIG